MLWGEMKLFVPKLLGSLLVIACLCHPHGASFQQFPDTECGSSGENGDSNRLNENAKADCGSGNDTETVENHSSDSHEQNQMETPEDGTKPSDDLNTLTTIGGESDFSANSSELPTRYSVPAAPANNEASPPPSGAGTHIPPPAVDGAGYLNGIPGGTSTFTTGGKHESSGFGTIGKIAAAGAAGLALGAIGSKLMSSKKKNPPTTIIHNYVNYGQPRPGAGSLHTPPYSTPVSGSPNLGNHPNALPDTSYPGTQSASKKNPGSPPFSSVSTPPTSLKRTPAPRRPSFSPPPPPTTKKPLSPPRYPPATASWIPLDQSSSTGLRPKQRPANSRFQKG